MSAFADLARHLPAAVVLTAFVTAIAYVRSPRAKALIYSLPVPFSCAYLATRLPINSTHIAGLICVAGYNWLVHLLVRARVPLLVAIPLSAGAYFLAGMLLRPLADVPVWAAAMAGVLAWVVALVFYRPGPARDHRSRTPWYVKAPLIFVIAVLVYNATGLLAGAVGTFPYAGIFTSYETRHSLRTLAGQFSLNALGVLGCMVVIHLAEAHGVGPWPALALGWLPVVAWVAVVRATRLGQPRGEAAEQASEQGAGASAENGIK